MVEDWRQVPGYEGLYEVSANAEIRRVAGRVPSRRWGYKFVGAKAISVGISATGYRVASLCRDGAMRQFKLHALVAAAFIGPRPIGHTINHKSGDKANNRPENLEYVTVAENNRHAYAVCNKAATLRRGERHPYAKLSDSDVVSIRARRNSGEGLRSIASDYNVCIQSVANIAKRKSWGHVA